MAKLLADENFEDEVVVELIALGHDVVTARAANLTRSPDPAVLARATAENRVLLTHDRDFRKLHNSAVSHAGIVHASADPDFTALATRIHAALAATPAPAGQLIRIGEAQPASQDALTAGKSAAAKPIEISLSSLP